MKNVRLFDRDSKEVTAFLDELYDLRDTFLQNTMFRDCGIVPGVETQGRDLLAERTIRGFIISSFFALAGAMAMTFSATSSKYAVDYLLLLGSGLFWAYGGAGVLTLLVGLLTNLIKKSCSSFFYPCFSNTGTTYEEPFWEDRSDVLTSHFGARGFYSYGILDTIHSNMSYSIGQDSFENRHTEWQEMSCHLYEIVRYVSYLRQLAVVSDQVRQLEADSGVTIEDAVIQKDEIKTYLVLTCYISDKDHIVPEKMLRQFELPEVKCEESDVIDLNTYAFAVLLKLKKALKSLSNITDVDGRTEIAQTKKKLLEILDKYEPTLVAEEKAKKKQVDMEKIRKYVQGISEILKDENGVGSDAVLKTEIADQIKDLQAIRSDIVFPTEIANQLDNLQKEVLRNE